MKAICVENMSKRFRLRRDAPRGIKSILRRDTKEIFWALRDIDFELDQGQALGIIGHNGAGKSTLLKLLTGIMEPTTGSINTRGRLSALIEIGAGFHPEMTGRENVYLNGAILGLKTAEISRKFDDIVGFAEIEKFIDVPVKRYSSGMYARLGFAVAAHVDPEILLVDEVLSVGDERFQAKCQQHMSKLMRGGATVLFVSHNLPAVIALCPECLVIDHGECVFRGASVDGVRLLRKLQHSRDGEPSLESQNDFQPVQITRVRLLDGDDCEVEEIDSGSELIIEISGRAVEDLPGLNFGVEIHRADGVVVFDINSRMDGCLPEVPKGDFSMRMEIPKCNLTEGIYSVSTGIMDSFEHVHYSTRHRCAFFEVRDELPYRGVARLDHNWQMSRYSQNENTAG